MKASIIKRIEKLEEPLKPSHAKRSRGEEISKLLRQLDEAVGGCGVPRRVVRSVIKELGL